jgi:hypothetical protein
VELGLRPHNSLFRIFGIVDLHCTYDVLDLGFVTIIELGAPYLLFYLF